MRYVPVEPSPQGKHAPCINALSEAVLELTLLSFEGALPLIREPLGPPCIVASLTKPLSVSLVPSRLSCLLLFMPFLSSRRHRVAF